jgi:hypothetical protein
MTIITVTSDKLIPATHEYQVFQGTEAECKAEFARRFPHYEPGMAYYHAPKKMLWVPMDVARKL